MNCCEQLANLKTLIVGITIAILLSLCSSLYCSVPQMPNLEDFTPLEREKIARSIPCPNPTPTIILPTMTVKFDIIIDGDSIIYDTPVFLLDNEPVVCQVCGKLPTQIEVIKGKLKCYCLTHIPRKRGSYLD